MAGKACQGTDILEVPCSGCIRSPFAGCRPCVAVACSAGLEVVLDYYVRDCMEIQVASLLGRAVAYSEGDSGLLGSVESLVQAMAYCRAVDLDIRDHDRFEGRS